MNPPVAALELDADWVRSAQAFPVIVWTARPDGSIEFVNKRFEELTGLAPESVLESGWTSIVHPDDLPGALAEYERSLRTGAPLRIDLRVRKSDGNFMWLRSQADALRGAHDEIVRWFGVVLDVDEVHRGAERFRRLADSVPVIVWTADPSGWIDWYNRYWYEYTGQTPQESAGWGWQAAHHPEDFLEVMRRWPNSIATGQPFEMEYRLRKRDGTFHWFLTRVDPMRDETGAVVRWYGTMSDVDLQRTAFERSRRIAETLQDVFLPKTLPQRSNLRLDAVYMAAERDALIGGDWFDAFELPDGRIVFSIGDVAGHGLGASITVGRLRQIIFTLAFRFSDPAKILEEVNKLVQYQEPGVIVTALVGFIDRNGSALTYACAGHPPPLIAKKGDRIAKSLALGGPPLGTGFPAEFRTHTTRIEPDSILAVYTDGMVEFSRDVIAAEQQLRTAVALCAGNIGISRPAAAIRDLVMNDALPRDDVALLVMQFSSVALHVEALQLGQLEKTWRFHSSHAYSAHTARREIGAYFNAMGATEQERFDAELVLGEILANTVEHAPGLVEVTVDWRKDYPVITVRDTGPGLRDITFTLPKDALNEDGRGLYLIRTLTRDVCVRESPGYGTEIRVVLPITKRPELPDSIGAPA